MVELSHRPAKLDVSLLSVGKCQTWCKQGCNQEQSKDRFNHRVISKKI
jgi:hypothetical protein